MNGQSGELTEKAAVPEKTAAAGKRLAQEKVSILAAGDAVTLLLVTVVGFAAHGELSSAGPRMLTTFLPLLAGWAAAAPAVGAYDLKRARDPRQVWRPLWAILLGVPLAALLRAVWLHSDVKPSFAIVLGGVSAAGILIWRLIYAWIARRAVSGPKN